MGGASASGARAGASSRGGASNPGGGSRPGGGTTAAGGAAAGGAAPAGGFGGKAMGGASVGGGFPIAGRGGGMGTGGMATSGKCCNAQMGPGCVQDEIEECVCRRDVYCCQTQWDATCVDEVESFGCGQCGGSSCDVCLERECPDALKSCFNDFGCVAILSCIEATGCSAFECYDDKACRSVIDDHGGLQGESMNTMLGLLSCAFLSDCPC